jgi:hypothetical protein
MIPLTPEVQQMLQAWQDTVPRLQKLASLVQAGWFHAQPGENLIDALIHDLTLTRAERMCVCAGFVPAQNLPPAMILMNTTLREIMHTEGQSMQQARYLAFAAAVESLVPIIRTGACLELLQFLQSKLGAQQNHCRAVLEAVKADPQKGAAEKFSLSTAIEAESNAFQVIHNWVNGMIAGGFTPDQVLRDAEQVRQRLAGLNAAAPLN